MILALNFTNVYWKRTSYITIKEKKQQSIKTANSPASWFYAVRPRTAVCSSQSSVQHASDSVSIDTELFYCEYTKLIGKKQWSLATENDSWEEFGKRVGNKGNNPKKPSVGKVPSDIFVQRMSSTASARLKKYEPLDTRDLVQYLKIMKNSI